MAVLPRRGVRRPGRGVHQVRLALLSSPLLSSCRNRQCVTCASNFAPSLPSVPPSYALGEFLSFKNQREYIMLAKRTKVRVGGSVLFCACYFAARREMSESTLASVAPAFVSLPRRADPDFPPLSPSPFPPADVRAEERQGGRDGQGAHMSFHSHAHHMLSIPANQTHRHTPHPYSCSHLYTAFRSQTLIRQSSPSAPAPALGADRA